MTRLKRPFFLVAACFLLNACITTQRTDLFFGTDIPGGGHVTEEQWRNFSDSVIAIRFPEGYTEWDAQGRWLDKDSRQTIMENTKVVTLIGKKGKLRNAALDTIIQAYIQRYKQQAVLRLDSRPGIKIISAE